MIISLIVAMDEKQGIGINNQLPWHISSDLKRFKRLTMGHHIVMGRKTYETIGKTLPGRKMIVLSRQTGYAPRDCVIAHTLDEALQIADIAGESECFIIGGGDVFQQALALADKIYLTTVHADVEVDAWFPMLDDNHWSVITHEIVAENEQDEYRTDFTVLLKKNNRYVEACH